MAAGNAPPEAGASQPHWLVAVPAYIAPPENRRAHEVSARAGSLARESGERVLAEMDDNVASSCVREETRDRNEGDRRPSLCGHGLVRFMRFGREPRVADRTA
jgi:hypothetical protein